MSNYIVENTNTFIPTSICNTKVTITIKKEMFLDNLNKRQLDMIKNNDKTKLLKTLKHMNFSTEIEDELTSLFSEKSFLLNETVVTQNNYSKTIFKFWEKEIETFKLLKDEISNISDITIVEILNADKSGKITLKDEKLSFKNLIITASYGNINQQKDTYIINKDNENISKDVGYQDVMSSYENASIIEIPVPEKKRKSQVLSDSEIQKLFKLSEKINEHFGTYKDIYFILVNNKLYVTQIEDIEIPIDEISLNKDIDWNNQFTNTKSETTISTYSKENLFFKNEIKTLTDIFYTYTPKQKELIYCNNFILNDSNIKNNIIKNSGVYLFDTLFFEQFFLEKNITTEHSKNAMYFLETARCYSKLYFMYKKMNKWQEKLLNTTNYLLNKSKTCSQMDLEELLSFYEEIKDSINKTWFITTYNEIYLNIVNNMIKRKTNSSFSPILTDNRLLNGLNKTAKQLTPEIKNFIINNSYEEIKNHLKQYPETKADIDIFISTYKNIYFTSNKIEEDADNIEIYKLLALWDTQTLTEISIPQKAKKLIKIYNNCQKRQETFFECKNIFNYIFNTLYKEIGLKLVMLGYISTYKDVYHLTIEEISKYTHSIIDSSFMKVTILHRKNKLSNNPLKNNTLIIPIHNIKGTIKKITNNNYGDITSENIVIVKEINLYMLPIIKKAKGIIIDSINNTEYYAWILKLLDIPYVECLNAFDTYTENEEILI